MEKVLKIFFFLAIMMSNSSNAFSCIRPNADTNRYGLYTKTPDPTLKQRFQQGVFNLFSKIRRPNQTVIEKLVTILAMIASIAIVVWAIVLGVIVIRGILSFLDIFFSFFPRTSDSMLPSSSSSDLALFEKSIKAVSINGFVFLYRASATS